MGYQADRDRCIATASARGIPFSVITSLLRYATTIERLNLAQCNGDYPADNGERQTETCPDCEMGWTPESFRRVAYMSEGKGGRTYYKQLCPDCRTTQLVERTLQGTGWISYIQGDPRGPGLTIYPVGTPGEDISNGNARHLGIYVPGRSR